MTNRKSTTGFPTSYMRTFPLSPTKGGSKNVFFKYNKFNFSQLKSATKFLCEKLPAAKL